MLRVAVVSAVLLIAVADHRPQGDDYQEAHARLERGLQALRQGCEALPDTSVAAIGAHLATPARCLAFVRAQLRFEPYAGVMRGSQGVLAAAGGNSAELCVLLRDLIAGPGNAPAMRFAIAELDAESAGKLVDAAAARLVTRPAALLPAGPLPPAASASAPAVDPRLHAAAAATDRLLRSAAADLEELAALPAGPGDDRAAAVTAARTHVWLQVQTADGWQSLDPVADLPVPPDARIDAALPDQWLHRLQVRIEVERLQDGKLQRDVLAAAQWPVAALQGRAVECMVLPAGLQLHQLLRGERQAELVQQSRRWTHFGVVLALTGETPQVGRSFDLHGQLHDAATPGATGVGPVDPFHRLPRAGTDAATSELSGLFLTARLSGPGGERSFERALLDRVGPAARRAGQPALAAAWRDEARVRLCLLQRHVLWAPAGASGQLAAREVLDKLAHGGALLAALELASGKWKGGFDQALGGLPDLPGMLCELGDAPLTLAEASAAGDCLLFVARPQLFLSDDTLDLRGGQVVSDTVLDVLRFGVGVVGADGPRLRRLAGCYVSELEAAVGGDLGHRAAAQLREAVQHGTPLKLVHTVQDLDAIDAGPDCKSVMRDAVQRGEVLLAMAAPFEVAGRPCTAWWRLDTDGNVLAVGGDGRGQGGMEGMTVLKDISIPMVRRCMTFVACLDLAIAGGGSTREAAANCMAAAIRDTVKQSLDQAIDTFVKDPLQQRVDAARAGMLGADYDKLYRQARAAWARYEQAHAALDDPLGQVPHADDVRKSGAAAGQAGADIGSAFGGRIYLLLTMGRDIADFGSRR